MQTKIILILNLLLFYSSQCFSQKPYDVNLIANNKFNSSNLYYYFSNSQINSFKILKKPKNGVFSIDSNYNIEYSSNSYSISDTVKIELNYLNLIDSTTYTDSFNLFYTVLGKANTVSYFYYMNGIYTINFINNSISDSAFKSFLWDFGDNTYSTDTNPIKTYANGGNYIVTLKAITSTDSSFYSQQVEVYDSTYLQALSDYQLIHYPQDNTKTVDVLSNDLFYQNVTLNVINNDNKISLNIVNNKLEVSIDTFVNYGYQNFTYSICKNGVCDTVNSAISMIINPSYKNCVPDFNFNLDKKKITFNNASICSNLKTYKWSFGDGNYSSSKNPIHTYNQYGDYLVCLETIDSFGIKNSKCQMVYLMDFSCKPEFGYQNNILSSQFFNSTFCFNPIENLIKYEWNFGDGDTSSQENPIHSYDSAGFYTVCLKKYSNIDTTETCKMVEIYDTTKLILNSDYFYLYSNENPHTLNVYSNDIAYKNNNFSIVAQTTKGKLTISKNGVLEYKRNKTFLWGEDEFKYSSCNSNRCDTTFAKIILEPFYNNNKTCIPEITYSGISKTISFSGSATCDSLNQVFSYLWYFSDGDTSSLQNPIHTFEYPGFQNATLLVIDTNGNLNSKTKWLKIKDTSINSGCVYAEDDYNTIYFSNYNNLFNVLTNDINIDIAEAQTVSLKDFSNGVTLFDTKGNLMWLPDSGFTGCDTMMYEVRDSINNSCIDTGIVVFCYDNSFFNQFECIDSSLIDTSSNCGNDYNPVCGCNKKEYNNYCEALKDGITYYFNGPCSNLPPFVFYNGSSSSSSEEYKIYNNSESNIDVETIDPNNNNTKSIQYYSYDDNVKNCLNIFYDNKDNQFKYKSEINCIGKAQIINITCDNWGYCVVDTLNISLINKQTTLVDNLKNIDVTIYPNPSNGIYNLTFNDINQIKKYSINDIQGKELSQNKITSKDSTIDLSNFMNGIYMLSIYDNDNNIIKIVKIIKN